MEKIKQFNIILASKSPRRQHLLKELGLDFSVRVIDTDEIYPDGLALEEIPVFLAELKAKSFDGKLDNNDLVITADTIVWLDGEVLGKPVDKTDAIKMLRKLSNNEHQVVTGVCLKSNQKQKSFYAVSNVAFKELTESEIEYYVEHYKPYDKAGAYGIQEWIGYIGITHIEGSFFNVMGLPIQKLYTELLCF
jgi:septum formation protein